MSRIIKNIFFLLYSPSHQKCELTKLILRGFKNINKHLFLLCHFRCHCSEQAAMSILGDFGDFSA